ncbi:transcription initiation factor TFIID subunit 7 isoform X2 [Oncorhynchus tshawytscha]|uniref:transcription initiation factor TFIID subunit 7 isoform X2 n=1 Tax=Oncorhynchus tshawytscha TaxID=74940 RepID=UPI000D0A2A17|nr:transcription initiation factor TFIID subunit 7 isoform X2 [Oncorhynchus tshawytscha]
MRVGVPIFLFLAAAGFHTALTASLESAEKEDTFGEEVGLEQLSDLQKRDQEEFEAAQMSEAVQDENTEEENDTQEEDMNRDGNVEADQHESESDEDVDGMRQKREQLEANVEEADETTNLGSPRLPG